MTHTPRWRTAAWLLAGIALGTPVAAAAQRPVVVEGAVAGIDPLWLTPTPRPAFHPGPGRKLHGAAAKLAVETRRVARIIETNTRGVEGHHAAQSE